MASKVTDLFRGGYHVEDPPIARALFASTGAAWFWLIVMRPPLLSTAARTISCNSAPASRCIYETIERRVALASSLISQKRGRDSRASFLF